MLFSLTLLLSTLMSISSMTWFSAWMGLEINLMSMVPLMKNFKNKFSSEAAIKYFITQATASMIFLFSILMMSSTSMFSMYSENYLTFVTLASLFLKMGAAPLHFWLPQVVSGLTWMVTTTILTIQKIAPMVLASYTMMANWMSITFIITSATISGILGINQTCLRKIMAFSSINNIGWMLSALMMSNYLWLIYFVTYSLITVSITLPMNENKMMFMTQISKLKMNKLPKLFLMMNFLSLGGLPPFTGFFIKWMTIYSMSVNFMFYTSIILILTSLLTLFMYIRLILPSMTLLSKKSMNLINSSSSWTSLTLNALSLTGLPMILIMA
uniref:NADH-ubiquinone oxidoreductase chain 2 n=1 Tax=Scolytinae sp. BMNH 1039994 TaxID=1903773 RepID=A0A343A5T7_9CUCU|nr:NADH dehydrogenase subunit 2 [Scolytinae sp. BMNH 1039994]